MNRFRIALVALAAVFLIGGRSLTGETERPLTNTDIVTMLRTDLGDDVIIAKIRQAPAEALDVSTDALVSLKKAGASKGVIEAMVTRTSLRSLAPPANPPNSPTADSKKNGQTEAQGMAASSQTSPAPGEPPCRSHFTAEGSAWTGKTFRTFADIPKVTKTAALDQVIAQVAGDGWQIVNTNKDAGLVSASRSVTLGQGRTVPLNVMISDGKPDGIHIEAVIKASGGLGPSEKDSKSEMCRIFDAAAR